MKKIELRKDAAAKLMAVAEIAKCDMNEMVDLMLQEGYIDGFFKNADEISPEMYESIVTLMVESFFAGFNY